MKRLRSADEDDEGVLLLWMMRPTHLPYRERVLVPDFRLNIISMSDQEAKDQFRFTVGELTLLAHHLKLPKEICAREGVRSNSVEALAVCLRRLMYPSAGSTWRGCSADHQRRYATFFYYVVAFLDDKLGDFLFFDTSRITQNLDRYCVAIAAKAPGAIEGEWGFIHGTITPICRPSQGQQAMYNGHKRVHALKFQTVVTPDGIISHLFGPVDGRRHDLFMLNESGLKAESENNSAFHNKLIYGDPAYGCTNVFCCPYKGCRIDAPQKELNKVMRAIRVSVEWSYGEITKYFSFLDFKRHHRIATTPTATLIQAWRFLHQLCDGHQRRKQQCGIPSLVAEGLRRIHVLTASQFSLISSVAH